MSYEHIKDWQRRLNEAQTIYATTYQNGEIINLYESKEAAKYEVEFHKDRGDKHLMNIIPIQVHTLQLSKERWKLAFKREE